MPNALSSVVFCVRSGEKAEDGNVARVPVAVGQLRNAIVTGHEIILSLDNSLSKSAQSAANAFDIWAKNNKIVASGTKAVNVLGKFVNPLIVVSSICDVARSEDKGSAFVTNGLALGSMFAAEGVMKKHFGENKITEIVKGLFEGKSKITLKALSHGTHGLLFCAASLGAYYLGGKFGDVLLGNRKPSK